MFVKVLATSQSVCHSRYLKARRYITAMFWVFCLSSPVITCQMLFAWQPVVHLQSIVPHHVFTLFLRLSGKHFPSSILLFHTTATTATTTTTMMMVMVFVMVMMMMMVMMVIVRRRRRMMMTVMLMTMIISVILTNISEG